MTAPKTKRQDPGYRQLSVWIQADLMTQLQGLASARSSSQRDVVETALSHFFADLAAGKVTITETDAGAAPPASPGRDRGRARAPRR